MRDVRRAMYSFDETKMMILQDSVEALMLGFLVASEHDNVYHVRNFQFPFVLFSRAVI